jgi:hypothetical protein
MKEPTIPKILAKILGTYLSIMATSSNNFSVHLNKFVTLKMEAARSSKMSEPTHYAARSISPDDHH